jgi:hypothetical protein
MGILKYGVTPVNWSSWHPWYWQSRYVGTWASACALGNHGEATLLLPTLVGMTGEFVVVHNE